MAGPEFSFDTPLLSQYVQDDVQTITKHQALEPPHRDTISHLML
jgi:hypothetical protein